ncbi:class I SAM-dependent methyltransferase [Sphingorhabdus sp. 109]|jgi:SAM-dependent methyltransferase|uniref:class I SAM-dependent methyltransferase n=1 Tax=Sphingorhabdus sp. 109 TaxID=2653173 RepID=UPI0012F46074|nr:class I SAM-dependent methyltransferase [Sphingorhabdus sp. 109]VWX60689.1 Ubiquinone/menaquinone biosynthesis methyltransferase [Sphingorhabdus sp. 109]
MGDEATAPGDKPEELKPEDWAGEMGLKWLANLSLFEQMIAPIGEALLARADYQDGTTVIDLGCGGGATTLAIADAVAPSGNVMGLDISPDLIAAAQERAANSGAGNIAFTCADAATVQLADAPYDRLFSRFGSMFFDDPVSAFRNLHGLLREGGRIDLAVWGPPRDNLWMMEMMGVVRNHVEIPPAVPRAPGPFAFEDLDYLGEILAGSGFTNVDVASYEALQPIGGIGATPEKAVEFAFASMAVGRALADKGAAVIEAASKELADLFAKYHIAGEGVMMKGKVWMVSATA